MNKVLNKVAALSVGEISDVLHFLNIAPTGDVIEEGVLRATLMNAFSTKKTTPKVFADMWQKEVNHLLNQLAGAHDWVFQKLGIDKPSDDQDFNHLYLQHKFRSKAIEPFSLLTDWNSKSELLKPDMMDFYDVSAEPHHKVEYSLNYFGGDFSEVGEFAYIPESLVESCESVHDAFTVVTGYHPRHIICTYDDERVDVEGNEYIEGAHFIKSLEVGQVVYWNDPDNALSSGKYVVVGIDSEDDIILDDTMIRLVNAAGGEAEVYPSELSPAPLSALTGKTGGILQIEPEDVEAREETHFDCWSESGDEDTPVFDWDGPESIAITSSLLTQWSKSLQVPEIHPDAIKGANASFVKWYLSIGQHNEGYPNALHVAALILADAGYDVYTSDTRIEIY